MHRGILVLTIEFLDSAGALRAFENEEDCSIDDMYRVATCRQARGKFVIRNFCLVFEFLFG